MLTLQALEANKVDWDKLFEPYLFFEAYKNYLQIDISAANDDDLRNWKGWVESRLRQLTLKVILLSILHERRDSSIFSYFVVP